MCWHSLRACNNMTVCAKIAIMLDFVRVARTNATVYNSITGEKNANIFKIIAMMSSALGRIEFVPKRWVKAIAFAVKIQSTTQNVIS